MEESKGFEDWAVVISGNAKYVGKVTHEEEEEGILWVVLNPCYEYISDLQIAQGPKGQIALMGRSCILVPYDHTLLPCPVSLHVTGITRLSAMAPADVKTYEKVIEAAHDMAKELIRKRDGVGLIVVPGSALPKGEPPRAS